MNQWSNPQNLKYIEDQVAALKKKHPESFPEKEYDTKRDVIDVLEEQLLILQNIQKLLEEQNRTRRFWKRF